MERKGITQDVVAVLKINPKWKNIPQQKINFGSMDFLICIFSFRKKLEIVKKNNELIRE